MIDGVEYKRCFKCGAWLPMNKSNFYNGGKNSPDGLSPWCNICKLEYQSIYHYAHPEEEKERC